MTQLFLLLSAITLGEIPVEWNCNLDDVLVRRGDIVYGQVSLRNKSNNTLLVPKLVGTSFDWQFVSDGTTNFLTEPLDGKSVVTIPLKPGETVSLPFVSSPWYALNRPVFQVKGSIGWPEFDVATAQTVRSDFSLKSDVDRQTANTTLSLFVRSRYHGTIFREDGKLEFQQSDPGYFESSAKFGISGTINIRPMSQIYLQQFEPATDANSTVENRISASSYPLLRNLNDPVPFARMAGINSSIFDVRLKAEFDDPTKMAELLKSINPQTRIHRLLELVVMANQWVHSDGEARSAMERAMLDHAAFGGPAERKFLKDRVEQLIEMKQFEQGEFVLR